MALPLISVLLFILAGFLTYLFVVGFIWGAGYQPSPKKDILEAGKLLAIRPNETIYDLGCGFGKVVFLLANEYPDSKFVGVDIDPLKSVLTKFALNMNGLSDRVTIVRQNLLHVDISKASGVYIFLSPETKIMEQLKEKMFREMKSGTHVVSYVHKFDDWKSAVQIGDLRLYIIPEIETSQSGRTDAKAVN